MFVYILSDFFNSFMCCSYMVPSPYDVLCVSVLQALTQDLFVLRMCFAIMSVAINWNSVIPSRNDEAFLTVSRVNSEECSAMYVNVLTSGV